MLKIIKHKFIRNISSVLSGSLIAHTIPIIGTLLIAKIFMPDAFGNYSMWLGGVMFLAVGLTFRFELSFNAAADGQEKHIGVMVTILTILFTTCSIVALTILITVLDVNLPKNLTFELIFLGIFSSSLLAFNQTVQNWASADGRYRHLVIIRIVQAITIIILQIIIGFYKPNITGLSLGYFTGLCTSLIIGIYFSPNVKFLDLFLKKNIFSYWKKNLEFVKFALPADLISSLTTQLPVIIVAFRFGSETAGTLAMALRVLGAPISLLSNSVLDVFKRYAGQAYINRGECREEYLHTFKILLIISTVSSFFIYIGAKPLFFLIFGEIWEGSGLIALWLLPRFATGFIASPLSYVVYITGKQNLDLIWQITLLIITLVNLFSSNSIMLVLVGYSLSYATLYIVYLLMTYHFSCGKKQ